MKKTVSSGVSTAIGSILLLAKHPWQVNFLLSSLDSNFSVSIAYSEADAVAHVMQCSPFLVIVTGDYLAWSSGLIKRLRSHTKMQPITLILLTDDHTPKWIRQEENPGFDGFLVRPISSEVLLSLVHSAYTRQTCFAVR